MAKRKRYSDEERAMLVAMLMSEGYTGNPATTRLGALKKISVYAKVPERTLQRWFHAQQNPPPDNLVVHKKEDLASLYESIVRKMAGELDKDDTISEMSGRDLATSIGILTDKMRLLRDEPTENSELRIRYIDDWRDDGDNST